MKALSVFRDQEVPFQNRKAWSTMLLSDHSDLRRSKTGKR